MAEYIDKGKAKELLNQDYAYAAADLLDKVPVEDVAEVKHGKWNKRHEHIILTSEKTAEWTNYFCSECETPQISLSHYCPECGAKMDKRGDVNE